jgi:thiol-disulfide isomerase/thioredoxin
VTDAARTEKPRPRWRWIAEVGVVLAILFAVRWGQTRGLPSGELPTVSLTSLDGGPLPLGTHERGYVVHFFATWCGVCRAEEGNVSALARDHELIAIATQSGGDAPVRAYVTGAGLDPAHVALDPDGAIAQRFGVRAFPTTLYVGRDGAIRTAEVGYTSELGMRLRAWWAE